MLLAKCSLIFDSFYMIPKPAITCKKIISFRSCSATRSCFSTNIFSLINVTFYKSCYQPLVLVKVLSGLLLSQQGKEEDNLPQPTQPKKFILINVNKI